ncbi:hypothetical protein KY290_010594 [Solanum tuberosum]|uniref:Uncharacterized protein n=1 Tax=Solanum tuberosum TaxID=4113 RepID=A0ABQ7VY84_SOLTU|nr:hypothetical protein KY290_010594 [Solanum tuberosum]
MWVLDSGCSRHMCGKKENFKTIKIIDGGCVRFGDNAKGEVTGVGTTTLSSSCDLVKVYLDEGLKHNLPNISQSQVILGYGIESLDMQACMPSRNYQNLNWSLLLHMDMFGPTRTTSIGDKRYAFVIVDDFSRCLIRPILKKTPYELWRGKKPNINYFHPFGCKCFIHNNGKNNLGKFDPRSEKSIFLGYAPISRAFQFFNKRTLSVEESVHVVFDDTNPRIQESEACEDEIESSNQQKTFQKYPLKISLKSQLLQKWSRLPQLTKSTFPGNGDTMPAILKTSFWENQMTKPRQDPLSRNKLHCLSYLKWNQNELNKKWKMSLGYNQ